jgi:hypothetical protein
LVLAARRGCSTGPAAKTAGVERGGNDYIAVTREPPEACKELVTDYPEVEIRVVAEGRTQSIRHYYGCIGVSEESTINEIAREIDKTAGVKSRTKGVIWHAR